MIAATGMEDKSPEWGRKQKVSRSMHSAGLKWKISPLNGDGNQYSLSDGSDTFQEWKISPLNGDGNRYCTILKKCGFFQWKISPLNGDGNNLAISDTSALVKWKISPLNGDGNDCNSNSTSSSV